MRKAIDLSIRPNGNPILCDYCGKEVSGTADVVDGRVLHPMCSKTERNVQSGRPSKCPECGGSGTVSKRVNGWRFEEDYSDFRIEKVPCSFCEGLGFLSREPQKEVTVTWKRG